MFQTKVVQFEGQKMIKSILKNINFSRLCKDYLHFFKWNNMIFLHNMTSLIIPHIKVLK